MDSVISVFLIQVAHKNTIMEMKLKVICIV